MLPNTTSKLPLWARQRLSHMTSLVSLYLLGKVDADEIVSPLRRLASARRNSGPLWCREPPSNTPPTSDAGESSEPPLDPCHLQNLPRRTSSSSVRTALTADPSVTSLSDAEASSAVDASATVRPLLPSRSLGASPRAPTSCFAPSETDESPTFYSTPYTMNMPAFRHGPIRIPKSGSLVDRSIMPDKTLDWTAFQVAILGGAGDLCSGNTDLTRRSDDELEDITHWFGGFGFESAGRLVRGRHSAPAHYRPGVVGYSYAAASLDADTMLKGCGRLDNRRSLPQSPMLELETIGGGQGGDPIIMGCNLAGDLREFLDLASQQPGWS
ncbi:hypothetical protein B0T11DRAFT_225038 [Plectosphaerella cucumerina]|uniref:Uncharacterized protein n=1 Tax=Plectosphaerella cucumerina TaxID=40658 RepID=A0A8K0THN1_9PEZI|nr:hypothetical protein B0T11DRAFT_225038 [Plectosphaerella cucumerina]